MSLGLSRMKWRQKGSRFSGSVKRNGSGLDPDAFSTAKLAVKSDAYEPLFYSESQSRRLSFSSRPLPTDSGDHTLLGFVSLLGSKAENLTIRFLNKTPSRAGCHFSYIIKQGTEEEDLRAVERDLTSGRLHRHGLALQGGAWSRLLLGPRFAVGASRKQVHELTYRRSSCTCLVCLIQRKRLEIRNKNRLQVEKKEKQCNIKSSKTSSLKYGTLHHHRASGQLSETGPEPIVSERSYSTPSFKRGKLDGDALADESESLLNFDIGNRSETDLHSNANPFTTFYPSFAPEYHLKANALQCMQLPVVDDLEKYLNADVREGEIELGTVFRSHARVSSKIRFCDEVRPMLEEVAFSGPVSTQTLTEKLIFYSNEHFKNFKGKRARKVFLRGVVVKLPIEVGVVKVLQRSMHTHENSAKFVLYGRQS